MTIATRTRVVLIQHVLEQSQRSNTGRHAAAALSSAQVRVFGAPHAPLRADDLGGAWLLWPGEAPPGPSEPRPSTLVVLDGSWSQARRMLQRVPQLRGLRRWSLPAPTAAARGGNSAAPGRAIGSAALSRVVGERSGSRARGAARAAEHARCALALEGAPW